MFIYELTDGILWQEELSTLKRQNVSRSLSFGMASVRDINQTLEDTFEMDQQGGDNLLDCESKGTRVSNKQVYLDSLGL